MNRNIKLKPLAPRPVVDQGCQQSMAYTSCASIADGRAGSSSRYGVLGVHASPLESNISMDPKDYVWGGGCYNASFYGCPQSAFAAAQPCYYPPAVEYPVSHQHYGKRSLKAHRARPPHNTRPNTSRRCPRFVRPGAPLTALTHLLLQCRLCSVPVRLRHAVHAVSCQFNVVCGKCSRQLQSRSQWHCQQLV